MRTGVIKPKKKKNEYSNFERVIVLKGKGYRGIILGYSPTQLTVTSTLHRTRAMDGNSFEAALLLCETDLITTCLIQNPNIFILSTLHCDLKDVPWLTSLNLAIFITSLWPPNTRGFA